MPSIIRKFAAVTLAIFALWQACLPGSSAVAESQDMPVYEPVQLEKVDAAPLDYTQKAPYSGKEGSFTEDGYLDGTLSVRIETTRAYDTDIWLCWIQVADASQLRTELANPQKPTSKATKSPMELSKRVRAVVALSGDSFAENQGKAGIIYRNTEVLLDKKDSPTIDALLVDDEGDFHILEGSTKENFAPFEGHIVHTFSFGPGLIVDGKKIESAKYKNYALNTGATKKAQRVAFCQVDHLSYLCVVTKGPNDNQGMTLLQMADFLEGLGVRQAYNLDGGSTSHLILNHEKVNGRSKRDIGDIIYFVTAEEE